MAHNQPTPRTGHALEGVEEATHATVKMATSVIPTSPLDAQVTIFALLLLRLQFNPFFLFFFCAPIYCTLYSLVCSYVLFFDANFEWRRSSFCKCIYILVDRLCASTLPLGFLPTSQAPVATTHFAHRAPSPFYVLILSHQWSSPVTLGHLQQAQRILVTKNDELSSGMLRRRM
jgi:hypothetical protein